MDSPARRRPDSPRLAPRLVRAVALACVLTAPVLFTACAPEPVTGAPSVSASSTATPTTPAPSATPSPAPSGGVVDSDEVDSWAITDGGIGPVALAMAFDAARATLPEGGWEAGVDCEWSAFTNTADGLVSLYFAREFRSSSGPVVEVGAVWNGDPGTARIVGPRTSEGLGVGSSRADVLGAHPDAIEGTSPVDGSVFLVAPTGSGSIAFSFATPSAPARSVSVSASSDPPQPVCG